MAIRDVILQQQANDDNSFEAANPVVKARTAAVDYVNSPKVNGKEGWIWIKEFDLDGGYAQVLNVGVPDIINLPVLLYQFPKPPYIRQARGLDHSELVNYDWDTTYLADTGPHAITHEWPDWTPGSDALSIYPRSVATLRTYPSGTLSIYVSYYRYAHSGSFKVFEGDYIDITSLVDTAMTTANFVMIYLDMESNTLGAVVNTIPAADVVGDQSDYWPDLPVGTIPSAVITLVNQSYVEETMITDIRDILGSVQQSNVSSSLDLLSKVESDLDRNITQVAVQAGPPERMKLTYNQTLVIAANTPTPLWYNQPATIIQDSDGGFAPGAGVNWYTIQRGGDYQFLAHIGIDPTTTIGVVSERVTFSVDVTIGGVPTGYPVYETIDPSTDTVGLSFNAYIPLLVRNNSIQFTVQHNGVLNPNIQMILSSSISVVGVDHATGV